MDEKMRDRRSRRSREALIHALLELIETKHYDQISVQDIIQQADVGRSTFYAHYQNKNDLLISGFEHLLERLVQEIVIDESGNLVFDTTLLFQHAFGHYEIYRTLIWGSGYELLIKDGHTTLSRKIEDRLKVVLPLQLSPAIPMPVIAYSIAGSLLVILKWWLDNKMPFPPERMDEIFQQLVMTGTCYTLNL